MSEDCIVIGMLVGMRWARTLFDLLVRLRPGKYDLLACSVIGLHRVFTIFHFISWAVN